MTHALRPAASRAPTHRSLGRVLSRSQHPRRRVATMGPGPYTCGVLAEPVYRYEKGGFHPLKLGDELADGRYKILHKVGSGGFSTTWAARDRLEDRYVALKISTSDKRDNRESRMLQHISSIPKDTHPGQAHIVRYFDDFEIHGPNGTHRCLALELLGPKVFDVGQYYWGRLPVRMAKSAARQVLSALDFLRHISVGHGDLHTGNVCFAMPDGLDALTEDAFVERLGTPHTGPVTMRDGSPLVSHAPDYLVRPIDHALDKFDPSSVLKIIDFGESFLPDEAPTVLNNPLVLRPPEVIVGDEIDRRVDLWSMGCMLFEMTIGEPPLSAWPTTPAGIMYDISQALDDALPGRWEARWNEMIEQELSRDDDLETRPRLQERIKTYYDYDCDGYMKRTYELTDEELMTFGRVASRLLRIDPACRASAADMLKDPWLA